MMTYICNRKNKHQFKTNQNEKSSIVIVFSFTLLNMEGKENFLGNAPSTNEKVSIPHGAEEIILHGTLNLGNGPSRIEAYLYGEFVYVNFNHNYGNVSVSLYNASGLLVYNDVVDTSVQPTVIIPVTGGTSGTYTLVLDSANGYAEGDFERDPQ